MLRDTLHKKLTDEREGALPLKRLLEWSSAKGTSTRVADHRIALVVPKEGMDIYDTVPTTKGVLFYSILPLRETHLAFLWGCGSNRNVEDDLIHNAMRVIHRLAMFPGTPKQAVTRQLSPSSKYEAFFLLVNTIMADQIALVRCAPQTELLDLRNDKVYGPASLPQEDGFDCNFLGEDYVAGRLAGYDSKLPTQFCDLHPFRVFSPVVWMNPRKNCGGINESIVLVG